jgi:hypothetical protein
MNTQYFKRIIPPRLKKYGLWLRGLYENLYLKKKIRQIRRNQIKTVVRLKEKGRLNVVSFVHLSNSSMAGAFHSVLNVQCNNQSVQFAVEEEVLSLPLSGVMTQKGIGKVVSIINTYNN